MNAIEEAKALGMEQGRDFFPIYDNCLTEFTPEERDGTTLTCVGFRPMDSEMIDRIGRKFHLYTD